MNADMTWKYIHPKGSIPHEGEAWMGYGTMRVDIFTSAA